MSRFNFIFFDPVTGDFGTARNTDRFTEAAVLQFAQPLGRASNSTAASKSSLYANNLFDENAKLSFDRERGGRARLGFNIGQPRTIGLTVRVQVRFDAGQPLRRRLRLRRRRRPSDADLCGRVGRSWRRTPARHRLRRPRRRLRHREPERG